jgi:hypothetical protein
MTSLTTGFKQSGGYFLVVGAVGVTYDIAAGSGAGGSFLPGAATVRTAAGATLSAGQILRDMGKTVLVGGLANAAGAVSSAGTVGVPTRVFRKVQLINTAGAVTLAGNAPNGVSGDSTTYQTFYIELPTLGRGGGSTNLLGGLFVYVNGLPGLYV